MSDRREARLVTLSDFAADGRRRTIVVTADERVVAATERAIRRRVGERPGGGPDLALEPEGGEAQ